MSRAAVKTDVERTAILLDLVHGRYIQPVLTHERHNAPISSVIMEEVAPSTGWGASRYADVLALSVWPSKGLTLDGYEIKASRADLKRELNDPRKHEALSRYCDSWTLVAWRQGTIDGLDIPSHWGVMVAEDPDDDGCYELVKIRKATKLNAEPWPRSFVCSLVRNAFQQSPRASYIAAVARESHREGKKSGEYIAEHKIDHELEPVARALWGKDRYNWLSRAELIKEAAAILKTPEDRAAAAMNAITGARP